MVHCETRTYREISSYTAVLYSLPCKRLDNYTPASLKVATLLAKSNTVYSS
nr:MAG TPA: hypothetical protein [Caudoviricetes sp.]